MLPCLWKRRIEANHTTNDGSVLPTCTRRCSAHTKATMYGIDGIVVALAQEASTSKGGVVPVPDKDGENGRQHRTMAASMSEVGVGSVASKLPAGLDGAAGTSEILVLREGQSLPDGYKIVLRDPTPATIKPVDLSTHADPPAHTTEEDVEAEKRTAAEKRNARRSTNKQALTSFAKEMKDSLAGGRPPSIKVSEDQTHLKSRWHSAAKEIAYKFLDLSKDGWKEYSHFERTRVHKELNEQYKFDPPIDPACIDKFLAIHLRSSRVVWKTHWLKHGDKDRHLNCPEDAWAKLIKWWCTPQCMEKSAEMAARRALVQKGSKSGRTKLVDRMELQASFLH
jgi:hypothetical protein